MTDIVERIRSLRYVHVPVASQLMTEAAAEIERLQRSVTDWRLESEVHRKRAAAAVAEIERLRDGAACPHVRGTVTQHCSLNITLTDEERAAIAIAADSTTVCIPPIKDTLRSLLERLS